MVISENGSDQIILTDGKYYFRGEDGGLISRFWEFEITKEDAEKIMQDSTYADKLFLEYQNKLNRLV